jgi:hypothetical protein
MSFPVLGKVAVNWGVLHAWRQFMVADVTHPLISIDLLSHFGVLVDCYYNRLLDGVMSLSVPAQAITSLTPSVKTINGGTPVNSLLTKHQNRHSTLQNVGTHFSDYTQSQPWRPEYESLLLMFLQNIGTNKTNSLAWVRRCKLYWPSDCCLSAKLVPTSADRGCRVVSATKKKYWYTTTNITGDNIKDHNMKMGEDCSSECLKNLIFTLHAN